MSPFLLPSEVATGNTAVKPSHSAHTLSRGLMLGAKRPQHKVTPFMLHGSIFVSWISSSVAPTLSISRYRYHFNRLHAFINHSWGRYPLLDDTFQSQPGHIHLSCVVELIPVPPRDALNDRVEFKWRASRGGEENVVRVAGSVLRSLQRLGHS